MKLKILFTHIILFVFLFDTHGQLSLAPTVGIGSFRKSTPYTGTVTNFITFNAKLELGYRLKTKPIAIRGGASLLTFNNIEESLPNGYERAYARYHWQQSYTLGAIYYFPSEKFFKGYIGGDLGYFRSKPSIFLVSHGPDAYTETWWDKRTMNRLSFGASIGLLMGKKRVKGKIELTHFFLSNYDFAKFAQEMYTSLNFGIDIILWKRK
jgi:hypothetical protein